MRGAIESARRKDHVEVRGKISPLHLTNAADLPSDGYSLDVELDAVADCETKLLRRILLDRNQRFGKDLSRFPPLTLNNLIVFGKVLEKRQDVFACQVPLLPTSFLLGGLLFLFFLL